MIKVFSLSKENEINKFIEEHSNDISGNGVMINVKPGECVVQTDEDIEKRSILQAITRAHGELLSKKLSREADKRFYTAELIKANGRLTTKNGGTAARDNAISGVQAIEKQMQDCENEINLYDHQLRTNSELVRDIKAGKYDDMFI